MPKDVKAYIKYIRMLLKKSNYDKYIDNICTTIENNNYEMTKRQYDILENYRKGGGKGGKGGGPREGIINENEPKKYSYIPYSFQPDTTTLSMAEHKKMLDDLREKPVKFLEYLDFLYNIKDDDLTYFNIYKKLLKANMPKLKFVAAQKEIIDLLNEPSLKGIHYKKIIDFYNKYKNRYPLWAEQNEEFFDNLIDQYVFTNNLNENKKMKLTETQLRNLIRRRIKNLLESPAPAPEKKPDVAEPDTDTPRKPRRRTLTPPKEAPNTRPKASTNENEDELINKIAQKYKKLKGDN
jgi:hypothetical protein